jgi:hypothetical protein
MLAAIAEFAGAEQALHWSIGDMVKVLEDW